MNRVKEIRGREKESKEEREKEIEKGEASIHKL